MGDEMVVIEPKPNGPSLHALVRERVEAATRKGMCPACSVFDLLREDPERWLMQLGDVRDISNHSAFEHSGFKYAVRLRNSRQVGI